MQPPELDARPPEPKAVELNAVVTGRIEAAPGLLVLRVAPVGWELPPFVAGQFAVLGLPASAPRVAFSDPEEPGGEPDRMIRRAYSITSASVERSHLELYLNLVRSGELTPRLFALETGDRLWLGRKISGMFTLREVPEDRHVVLVATGTGLAPYLSMLRSELLCGGPRRFAVLAGARHSWDLGYSAELYTMARLCPNFVYLPTVSRPEAEPAPWGGHVGYVQRLWTDGVLERALGFRPTPADTHVFLCGNPGMIDELAEVLGREGFRQHGPRAAGELHVERYW